MKHLCNISDTSIDFLCGELSRMQWKRHILVNTEVWIEDMRLEDESDIAFGGGFVVDTHIVQIDCAFFGFVQSGDAAKRRRFPGTRLTKEHEKFLILDIERDVVKRDEIAKPFCDVFEPDCCHTILQFCVVNIAKV